MPTWLNRRSLAWALSDLANTIFSMGVVTLYFPLFLVTTLGEREILLSAAIAVSMALGALTSPFLGALSDSRFGKHRLLAVATILCCLATTLIPMQGVALAVVVFIIANYLYQVSLVVYDALLPAVASGTELGPVSGFGVALGYLGTFVALAIGKLLVEGSADNGRVFFPIAVTFLFFALPVFFLREDKGDEGAPVAPVPATFRRIIADRNLRNYFLGHLFYLDAVNTVIAFMALFLVKVAGFSQEHGEVTNFFAFATIFAVVGGLAWGWVVRRFGARQALLADLTLWSLALLMVLFPLPSYLYWVLGPVTGIALGGTWSCDRPLLLSLIDHRESGTFFGFYYLTGKVSAIVGPLLFGAVLSLPLTGDPLRYRLGFGVLLVMVLVSLGFIGAVDTTGSAAEG
ncbi:MAG TPA: MFS transporter [Geobacterales bacterium]|nr:MFS transporter [Geobacterales bacterium]